MKCVKRIDSENSKVIRVSNHKAEQLVNRTSLWKYTNKQEWKDGGRKR